MSKLYNKVLITSGGCITSKLNNNVFITSVKCIRSKLNNNVIPHPVAVLHVNLIIMC